MERVKAGLPCTGGVPPGTAVSNVVLGPCVEAGLERAGDNLPVARSPRWSKQLRQAPSPAKRATPVVELSCTLPGFARGKVVDKIALSGR
jgi:hypothetical protein